MQQDRFTGKVIVVTGAAGDIGSAVIARLLREGGRVAALDSHSDALDALSAREAAADRLLPLVADVTDESSMQSAMTAAADQLGGIDGLFNNAGIEGECGDIADCDVADFDRVMAVNVRGVLLGMKCVIPHLRQRGGGAILNTASVAGMSGAAGLTAYCTSKHAVIGLTRSAARQQGPQNIRANAVCPSAMSGRMMASIEDKMAPGEGDMVHDAVQAAIPLGRYAAPSDVASMVAHLLSDDACFLNGGIYAVDGGFTA